MASYLIRRLTLLCALSFCLPPDFAEASPNALSTVSISESVTDISDAFSYLEDPDGKLQPRDILNRLGSFQKVDLGGVNFGLTPTPYWFALWVKSDLPDPTLVMDITYPLLDFVDFYQYRRAQSGDLELITEQLTGDRRSFHTRYRKHRTINTKLVTSAEASLVLIRVQTSGSVQLPTKIYRESTYGDHAATENAGLFFYYGIIAVMALFNLFLWVQTRESTYLPYVGYLLMFLTFSMTSAGTLSQWLLPSSPNIVNLLMVFSIASSMVLALAFTRNFNTASLNGHILDQIIKGTGVVAALTAGVSLAAPYQYTIKVTAALGVITPVLIIAVGLFALRRGYRPARYFLVAWAAFMIGVLLYSLKAFGLAPHHWFTEFGVQIGCALEVTLLSLALGDRMQEVARERDRLNIEHLKASEALAEESLMRSEAERRARIEAETKVMVFSDAVHHLNNPLNQIVGSNQITQDLSTHLNDKLNHLLHTDPIDPETEEVRLDIDHDFKDILLELDTIDEASNRASDTVSLLRIVSGIDGTPTSTTKAGEIFETAMRRLPGSQSKLMPLLDTQADISVIGHPALYAQAIELVERALEKCGIPELPMSLESHGDTLVLTWKGSPDCGLNLLEQETITKTSELIEHLLRPYQCRLAVSDKRLALDLCQDSLRPANDQLGSALVSSPRE